MEAAVSNPGTRSAFPSDRLQQSRRARGDLRLTPTLRGQALKQMQAWAAAHKGEVPPGTNLGPFVAYVLAPMGLAPPQPYCAATISMAFQEAAAQLDRHMPFLNTAGALALFHLGQSKGWEIKDTEIQPGDLIFWHRGPVESGLGHVGIVEYGLNLNGNVQTIEANHSSTVDHFHYDMDGWLHNFVGAIRVPG